MKTINILRYSHIIYLNFILDTNENKITTLNWTKIIKRLTFFQKKTSSRIILDYFSVCLLKHCFCVLYFFCIPFHLIYLPDEFQHYINPKGGFFQFFHPHIFSVCSHTFFKQLNLWKRLNFAPKQKILKNKWINKQAHFRGFNLV